MHERDRGPVHLFSAAELHRKRQKRVTRCRINNLGKFFQCNLICLNFSRKILLFFFKHWNEKNRNNDLRNESLLTFLQLLYTRSKERLLFLCTFTLTFPSRLHVRLNVATIVNGQCVLLYAISRSCRASLVADVRATLLHASLIALVRCTRLRWPVIVRKVFFSLATLSRSPPFPSIYVSTCLLLFWRSKRSAAKIMKPVNNTLMRLDAFRKI